MNTAEVLEMSGSIRRQVAGQQRIGVTELARGTAWRDKLAEHEILEVVDRGATAGWLLSQDGMASLLDTIAHFEEEAERAQVACLVHARASRNNWKTGDDLHQAIDAIADGALNDMKTAFDG